MTALSANKPRKSRGTVQYTAYKVEASTTIYEGSIVALDSAGYAAPAGALATNNGCVGVSTEYVDNSSGAAGAKTVKVAEGEFLLPATSIAQANVGEVMYGIDDDTIDETNTSSNKPRAGILTEYVSSTSGWCRITLENSR